MGVERVSSDLSIQHVLKECPNGSKMISIRRHRTLDGMFLQTSPKDGRLLHLRTERSGGPEGVPPPTDTLPTNSVQIVAEFILQRIPGGEKTEGCLLTLGQGAPVTHAWIQRQRDTRKGPVWLRGPRVATERELEKEWRKQCVQKEGRALWKRTLHEKHRNPFYTKAPSVTNCPSLLHCPGEMINQKKKPLIFYLALLPTPAWHKRRPYHPSAIILLGLGPSYHASLPSVPKNKGLEEKTASFLLQKWLSHFLNQQAGAIS